MLGNVFKITWTILQFFLWLLIPVLILVAVFALICFIWFLIFKHRDKKQLNISTRPSKKKRSMLLQLLIDVPRRYVLDLYEREPDEFDPFGIHVFCGEQGCGKSIGAVEMMLRLKEAYPKAKMITNFSVVGEDDPLEQWQQLLTYVNGKQGVIVGMDEIQNWFMSGLNKLPEQMLEVATQNRKNHRIIVASSQVFTRVNKGLREQFTMVYHPHTFLKCFTVVIKRKPVFDNEGNVIDMKYRGMYSFVHTDELRSAYDTYKVIHTLAKEGFKDVPVQPVTNIFVAPDKKRR